MYFFLLLFFPLLPESVTLNTQKKKKKNRERKKILQPPNWPQIWPPAGRETNFFLRVAWTGNTSLFLGDSKLRTQKTGEWSWSTRLHDGQLGFMTSTPVHQTSLCTPVYIINICLWDPPILEDLWWQDV